MTWGLDPAGPEPASQPEAVPAGLEGDGNAFDLVPRLFRLHPPSIEQRQQFACFGLKLLQRLALNARYNSRDEPALLAHLDHRDQCVIRIERCKRTAQIVYRLAVLLALAHWGGSIGCPTTAPMDAIARLTVRRTRVHRRSPHSISESRRNRCAAEDLSGWLRWPAPDVSISRGAPDRLEEGQDRLASVEITRHPADQPGW